MKFSCNSVESKRVSLEQDGDDVNILVDGEEVAYLCDGRLHLFAEIPRSLGLELDSYGRIAIA